MVASWSKRVDLDYCEGLDNLRWVIRRGHDQKVWKDEASYGAESDNCIDKFNSRSGSVRFGERRKGDKDWKKVF